MGTKINMIIIQDKVSFQQNWWYHSLNTKYCYNIFRVSVHASLKVNLLQVNYCGKEFRNLQIPIEHYTSDCQAKLPIPSACVLYFVTVFTFCYHFVIHSLSHFQFSQKGLGVDCSRTSGLESVMQSSILLIFVFLLFPLLSICSFRL